MQVKSLFNVLSHFIFNQSDLTFDGNVKQVYILNKYFAAVLESKKLS